ncbi:MAG: PEGA domain-containing protein [Proteobacteria bacterium]|jgi:hypothetical protein|nr:PEGA domain-containing protein [Pseudomonadota bacterium]
MSRCPHCGDSHNADNHFCPATGKPIDLGPRLIGLTLLDRFKVVTILGEGPTGIVLQVEDVRTKQKLAAKLTHPRHARGSNAGDILLKEAAKAGRLGCPNIAHVVEVGRDTGAAPVVVRELMVGSCLADYLEEKGPLPVGEALQIAHDILVALAAIHKAGLLNLDLSPADVFLDDSSGRRVTKLVDFGEGGIKQQLGTDTDEVESHKYYAPEQLRKGQKADSRADVFAAGAILYQMLAGTEPARIPTPVNASRKDIDARLVTVVHKAIATAPESRFQSATDFIGAIDDFSRGAKAAAAPAKAPATAPLPAVSAAPPAAPKPAAVAKPAQAPAAPVAASAPLPLQPAAPAPAMRPAPEPAKVPTPAPAPAAPVAPTPEAPVLIAPTGSDEELAQPSVIVDMPEVAGAGGKKKVIAVVVVVCLVAIAAVVYFLASGSEEMKPPPEPLPPAEVTITIKVVPESAVVSVDGERVAGNPPIITVAPSDASHAVKAKADGYESLEKDVKFDATKTIDLQLIEVVAPSGETAVETPPPPEPVVVPEPSKVAEPKPAAKPTAKPTAKPAAKPTAKPATKPATKPAEKPKTPGKKKGGFDTSNPYG